MTISHRFVLYTFLLFIVSCSRLYHGAWNQPYFDENVQPVPQRLKRLLGEEAGSIGVENRGHTIELGRFKRPGYLMGSVRADIEVRAPRKR